MGKNGHHNHPRRVASRETQEACEKGNTCRWSEGVTACSMVVFFRKGKRYVLHPEDVEQSLVQLMIGCCITCPLCAMFFPRVVLALVFFQV